MNEEAVRAKHYGAELVDLKGVDFTQELLSCIPTQLARRLRVLPVFNSDDVLKVAMADPSDLTGIESLHDALHREVELCVADETQLDEFIERLYSGAEGAGG